MDRTIKTSWVITHIVSDGIIEEFDNKTDAVTALGDNYEIPTYTLKACAWYEDDDNNRFIDYSTKKAIGKLKKYEFETVTIKKR